MDCQRLSILQVLKPVHWMLESPLNALSISFMIANNTRMEKKAKVWVVTVSFMETISNWPTKAGNHAVCENESFLCGCVCVCLPGVATSKGTEPGNGEQEPWGHQCDAGVRKKPFLNCGISGTAQSGHCSALFKRKKLQETQVWALPLDCSLLTWKKPGIFSLFSLSQSLVQSGGGYTGNCFSTADFC